MVQAIQVLRFHLLELEKVRWALIANLERIKAAWFEYLATEYPAILQQRKLVARK